MSFTPTEVDRLPEDLEVASGYQEIRSQEQRHEAASRWPLLRSVNRAMAQGARAGAGGERVRGVSGRYDLTTADVAPSERAADERSSNDPAREQVSLGPMASRRTA